MERPTKMHLKLIQASKSDSSRIADIHMSAFGTNKMLLAQFPTPEVRAGLWTSLVEKALAELRDPKWKLLLVQDERSGTIISFAKWSLPIRDEEEYVEEPWVWPEGTAMGVLDEWTEKVEAAGEKLLGTRPCYRLSFIATHPDYERRGAASLLINWGLERSKRENIPAVLESTPNAAALYKRLGFRAEKTISMMLDHVGEGGQPMLYEETCFVFWPDDQGRA